MENKFYITTPIYYASGKPHIGHAFTTIYADILARYHKSLGKEVFFSVGMDEHGAKIAEKAKEENKSPQEFVDEISKSYIDTWSALNIEYSDFIRTTSQKHKETVNEFIKKIYASGDIYEGIYEGLYCVGCEKFLTEKELENGACPDHLTVPQKIKEKNYFFNLKKYLPEIERRIRNKELGIRPESRKNEILNIIDSGISDFSITREKKKVGWGIPFPYDDSQIIYVWADALVNYLSPKDFWPADLHVIGADINKFHAIFWPGLLLSARLPLPKNIFVHGLFTINGQKISKTVGNIIDPLDMIEKFGVDATRYLLLSQFPASEHGDIKETGFEVKYNADLANGIGNLFERVFTMIREYKIHLEARLLSRSLASKLEITDKNFKNYMDNFQLFEALREVLLFAKKLDGYITEIQPWVLAKNNDPKLEEVLNYLFSGIEKIIEWLKPFMPEKTKIAKDYAQKIKSGDYPKEKLGLFPRK